jgi:AcrR family transcriptional regulator
MDHRSPRAVWLTPSQRGQQAGADMDAAEFQADRLDTRTKLILAAERLFGQRGIDAVPLGDIIAAAGQRNASALQYHIGGREQLVVAILEFRRAAVDARRVELLDHYESSGIALDEAAIAAGLIMPLVELMLSDPSGGNYICFVSQAFITERPDATYRSVARHDRGWRRCERLYRERHADIPARQLAERFSICSRLVFFALADWQRDTAAKRSSVQRSDLQSFAGDLIAMTASALCAVRERERRFVPFPIPQTRSHHPQPQETR